MKAEEEYKYTNALIHQTSPYLLQHAHNPVNWQPWNESVLEKAKKENKILIISIGYSACHWCHVMEKESFEDQQVAEIMNSDFVCIKVDREERPDIDQVYMHAVQIMTGSGGWPLNCFALPDGKPIYGGTYFPKAKWLNVLQHLINLYKDSPEKVLEYATQLTHEVQASELPIINNEKASFTSHTLEEALKRWKKNFDTIEGGPNRVPKFPLPNNYIFLLDYGYITHDQQVLQQVNLTLSKMAYGGIYDQLGGGFARYSTDHLWKVPHFEKMLYDNAQLISLYSLAYQATKNNVYKQVVYETLSFIKHEITAPNGAFYSAIDADSEGKEGKYYIWSKPELKEILKEGFDLFSHYYNVNSLGYWEDDQYILLRKNTDKEIAEKFQMSVETLEIEIKKLKGELLKIRKKRITPGLDDKCLTSWNALMLKGYIDAYMVFNEPEFLEAALKNAEFILSTQQTNEGGLFHNYNKKQSTNNGFLEDYAFTIEAFLALYQTTFDEKWLGIARELIDYVCKHFYDKSTGLFFFTSDIDQPLIARKIDVTDNVIPASNSSLALSIFLLGKFFDDNNYLDMSARMLNHVISAIPSYAEGYSNWAILLAHFTFPFYEIAVVGEDAEKIRKELNNYYLPNKIILGSKKISKLPLLENKFVQGETLIYICVNKNCQLPVRRVDEAIKLLNNTKKPQWTESP